MTVAATDDVGMRTEWYVILRMFTLPPACSTLNTTRPLSGAVEPMVLENSRAKLSSKELADLCDRNERCFVLAKAWRMYADCLRPNLQRIGDLRRRLQN